MTTLQMASFALVRVALPLCLAAFAALRQNGLSLIYLLLLLCLPLVPAPSLHTMAGHTGRYLKAVVALSTINVLAQLVFQSVLLALPPYAHFLTNCEWLETLLRHIGLVRLDGVALEDAARLVAPDVAALLVSIVVLTVCLRLRRPPSEEETRRVSQSQAEAKYRSMLNVLASIGKFLALGSLCVAGSLRPSVPGGIYFLAFLGGATAWACRCELRAGFAWLLRFCALLSAVHLLALFLYQTPYAQQLLAPDLLVTRLLGMTPLTTTSCTEPRHVTLVDAEWATFLNPLALIWLYFVLVFEIKLLGEPVNETPERSGVTVDGHVTKEPLSNGPLNHANNSTAKQDSVKGHHRRHSRRRTIRWKSGGGTAASQRRDESGSIDGGSDLTPLMKGSHHSNYEAVSSPPLSPPATTQAAEADGTGTVLQDSTGSRIWSPEDQENIALKPIGAGDDNHAAGCEDDEDDEPSVFELLLDGVLGLLGLVIRSSYIATNIIMMAWSIAYHSWLTFVLLLWASLLWITPNQRRAMLRCSPVLVLYAQFLLLAQYVYSLDLNAEELPQKVDWVNLKQIGLIKPASLPVRPLIVKSLFTVMFWVTLRQFMQERWEAKHSSALVEGVAEPFNITVSTTAGGLTSELSTGAANEAPQATGSTVLARLGAWLQSLLTKFWIWVVAIMLFVIGLGSGEVVLYRIVYMALFLVFVLTFQLSYRVWRAMMYGFWLTVIVYSMLVLVLIYTYQFDNFPEYWHNYTGIPRQLQRDIGLEVYDTGALFVRLLTPTFFVVITVIQLHYFHRDFLAISDIRYKVLSEADPESALTSLAVSLPTTEPHKKPDKLEIVQVQEHPITPKDLSYEAIRKMSTAHLARLAHHTRSFAVQVEELCWRLLELHMAKIALLSVMLMAFHDVCAAHAILVVLAVAALPMRSAVLQRIMLHVCSGLVCLLILAQMTYQIKFIDHTYWNVNCTDLQSLNSSNPLVGNKTLAMNDAEWLGLKKSSDLPDLLRGYIGLVLVLTFQAVVRTRQQYQRRSGNDNQPPSSPTSRDTTSTSFVSIPLLFPGVTRALADEGLMPCAKFLLNFGFYKFGVEVCLMALVVLIGTRLDIYSIVYAVWLAILFRRPRAKLTHIWRVLILFLAIFTPLQYLMCVGVPPGLCLDWPWYLDEGLRRLQVWLFFPDYVHPPECPKLICDFVVLLLVCRQQVVFRVERSSDASTFAGGSNAEVFDQLDDIQDNPVPDFITYTKSWLDTVKRGVLRHSYWVTLVVVLVTGVNRDNLFSLGYLVGAFFFLHHGNDLYLLPVRKILHWWNILLSYNVAVIGLKAVTQMLGCLFVRELQTHACWLVQLLSVACLSKFGNEAGKAGVVDPSECTVSPDQTGLVWDGVCFGFLLMQRRLFSSYYFARIVDEAKAQTILASRGAELIEQLRRKRVAVQREEEQRVLDKIRTKMERIKENQRRMQGDNFREPQSHQKAPLETHSCLSSPHTPQGYHTPVEDDPEVGPTPLLTPQRLSQLLGSSNSNNAPTPTSAAYTISLDGYLDPGRMSIGSPPHLPSDDEESFPVFSPPPYEEAVFRRRHRRSSSSNWPMRRLSGSFRRRRRSSLVPPIQSCIPPAIPATVHDVHWQEEASECRQSVSLSPVQSHHASIRSGDYYMFEEFDDDLLDLGLEPPRATLEEVDDDSDPGGKITVSKYPVYPYVLIASPYLHHVYPVPHRKPHMQPASLPQLLSNAMKTNIEDAADNALVANLQEIPMADADTPKPIRRKKSSVSYLSGRSDLGQPSTSASQRSSFQSGRIPPLSEADEPTSPTSPPPPQPPGDEGPDETQLEQDVDAPPKEDSWAKKMWIYMKFVWALVQSGVVSATKKLNKLSSDYRYVAKCLATETLQLKERGDYRNGQRVGQGMWRPLPVTLPDKREGPGLEIRIVGASDEATLNVDRDEAGVVVATDVRTGSTGSDEDKQIIPTIRIWAASLEKGLDSECASPSSDRGVTIDPSSIRPEIAEPKRSLTTGLLHAAWFAVLAHSELVCYCMVFLHQVKSASILSLPLPIMVFLWGSLSVPRPSKFFWVTIIGYTEMVVIAKYLCQFEYLPWNQQAIPYNQPFWGPRITGVERKDMYALYDLMLLLVVFFHRFMLKSLGLWGDADEGKQQQEEVTSVMAAAKSPVPSVRSREDEPSSDVSSSQQPGCGSAVSTRVRQTAANLPAPLKQVPIKLTASIRGFFAQLLEPSSRVTADVYAFMFICDFFNFMVVIFGFASFGTQQGDGGVSAYLEENKVPVAFLVMLILQFALMVVDRALFLRKFILGKIMFQVGLVIGVHLWMFFLLPSLTERPFSGALPPQIWYLVKCLYLLLSAYQIRCGYPTRILGNFLCKKYNYLNMFLFKGFMAVPFLFELRTLMDWMWTKTSMTLGEWIKMEDIFAHIFQLKCQRRAEAAYPRPPGEEQRPLIKYVVGGCSLLVVIFIIWFPMVLFALGNTVGQPNLPYDVSVELTIGPYQPVFRTSAQNSSLKAFSEANWEALSSVYKRDRAAQTFLSNYDFADVASAKIDTFSMSVWTISEQAQKKMIGDVLSDDPILVKFSWTISRHSDNPSTVGVVTETQTNFLEAKLDNGNRNPERLTLANMLNTSYDDPLPPLRLQNLLPKFIKVSNRGKATVVPQLMKNKKSEMAAYRDLYLTLDRNKNGQEQWWAVHESCNDTDYKELYAQIPLSDKSCSFLNIYSFNDKAFPATLSFFSGGGIIGLYTTLVLVASKFMRGFFSGVCFTIMFDDLPDVDRILQLCLDIYLVRESGELSLEEALAAKLIFLFRSPSTLIKWTRPREEEDASSDASSDVEQSTSQAVVPRSSHD